MRCCNNGITGWVDEYGRFHGVTEPVHSTGVRVVEVPLRTGPHAPTVYQRAGDWLSWACVLACGILAVRRGAHLKKDSASGGEAAK